jgi:protein-S-isoprenylcysteine O-methyltransferase Ste14
METAGWRERGERDMRALRTCLLPPVAMLLLAGAMWCLHRWWPAGLLLSWPWRALGLLPLVAGLAMAQRHARMFRRIGTEINTFGRPGRLVTEGLFARTRNPMYLGMLLCLVGVATLLGSVTPWLGPPAFFTLASLWYIPVEERAMAEAFGGAYADYRRRVRRWL